MGYIKSQIDLIKRKDPAIKKNIEVFLYPSFKAVTYYRIAHYFYLKKHFFIARLLSEKAKKKTGIEIHPGAKIGKNFFIDHGTGVVIGETTIIGDNVMLGAGSKILNGVTIGDNAKVGANCVVVQDIPADATCVLPKSRIIIKNEKL